MILDLCPSFVGQLTSLPELPPPVQSHRAFQALRHCCVLDHQLPPKECSASAGSTLRCTSEPPKRFPTLLWPVRLFVYDHLWGKESRTNRRDGMRAGASGAAKRTNTETLMLFTGPVTVTGCRIRRGDKRPATTSIRSAKSRDFRSLCPFTLHNRRLL